MDIANMISNLKLQNNNTLNELNKNGNSYIITGINDYIEKKNNSFNKKNLIAPLYSKFNITNCSPLFTNEMTEADENEEKLAFIRNLIKKPSDKPYDGYACFRKKPTTNYLLKKIDKKEEPIIFEEHKLCKIPYPLIKFISNRKSPNKSKELMTDILGAELNDLSAQQKNDIKYKNYKKPIKITKSNYPDIKINSNFYTKKSNFSEMKKIRGTTELEFPLVNRYYSKKERGKDGDKNSFDKDTYSFLTSNRPSYNNRRIKNSLIKSYCGDDINLTEHSTYANNISVLTSDVSKKLNNKKLDNIIKDISVLKFNSHLMAYDSNKI